MTAVGRAQRHGATRWGDRQGRGQSTKKTPQGVARIGRTPRRGLDVRHEECWKEKCWEKRHKEERLEGERLKCQNV